jgi:plasmid stability protein
MRRTLVQLDEATYQRLRSRAFREARSMSAVVREVLARGLEDASRRRKAEPRRMRSVASGTSRQGAASPVSVRHDEALADAFRK